MPQKSFLGLDQLLCYNWMVSAIQLFVCYQLYIINFYSEVSMYPITIFSVTFFVLLVSELTGATFSVGRLSGEALICSMS